MKRGDRQAYPPFPGTEDVRDSSSGYTFLYAQAPAAAPGNVSATYPFPTMPPAPPPEAAATSGLPAFLGPTEVAGLLSVCTATVYRLVEGGELPAHRFRRRIRVSRADLEAYLARSRQGRRV